MLLLTEGDVDDLLGVLRRAKAELPRRNCENCPCPECYPHTHTRRELGADIDEAVAWVESRRGEVVL